MRRIIGRWIQIGLFAVVPATAVAQTDTSDTRTEEQKQQDKGDVPLPMGTPSDTNPNKDFNKLDETHRPGDVQKPGDVNKPSETGDVNKPGDTKLDEKQEPIQPKKAPEPEPMK